MEFVVSFADELKKGCLFPSNRNEKRAEIIPIEPDAGNAAAGRYGKTIEKGAAPSAH